ncbi:MAG: hypothetical protein ACI4U0_01015 [Candidatus Aphodocola sp.]
MKKSKKILITLIIIVILSIIGILLYNYFSKDEPKEVKTIKSIPEYGYELKENETKLYKDEFDNLDKILSKKEVDYEEYAKQIAKLFIIDFYTLDNKLSKNDIGGTDFIKDDMKDNFIEEARSTFYKYLEVNSSDRNQELPIVSEIKDVEIENTTFVIKDSKTTTSKTKTTTSKGTQVDAYKVTISWDYKEDYGYEKEANMIIIKEDKKLYIVEMD